MLQIRVQVTSGNQGTDGPVFLGLGGREYRLLTSGNDFRPDSTSTFVLGSGSNVRSSAENDPNIGFPLDLGHLREYPVYLRTENKNFWHLWNVSVVVEDDGDLRAAYRRSMGDGMVIGPGWGQRVDLVDILPAVSAFVGNARVRVLRDGVWSSQSESMTASFEFDRSGACRLASAPPIGTVLVGTAISATLSLSATGEGSFDASAGRVVVPCRLQLQTALGNVSADFTLSTDGEGTPMETDGGIVLYGESTTSSNLPIANGLEINLRLRGSLDPVPGN